MPTQQSRVRVVIADDHPLYREALARTLADRPDFAVEAVCSDGDEALREIRRLQPDVAVLDMIMPGVIGIDILDAMKRDGLATKVLFLSAGTERELVYEAIARGAKGYLSKDVGAAAICDAVEAVARGEAVLSPEVQSALASEIAVRAQAKPPLLTSREREILALAGEGHSNREIAQLVHLSPSTVKTHLEKSFEKLGVSDRTAAVVEAIRRGLLE